MLQDSGITLVLGVHVRRLNFALVVDALHVPNNRLCETEDFTGLGMYGTQVLL